MLWDVVRNWWVVLVRGIAAIAFGILAFLWPGLTLLALVILFGAYAFVDGITAIALSMTRQRGNRPWWAMLLVGLAGVAAGLVTFLVPGITAITLLAVIAAWAIVRGVLEIVAAVRLRRFIPDEWMLFLAGALSIVWGLLMFVRPAAGALSLIWVIAAFAIAFGIVDIALAIRLKDMKGRVAPGGPVTAAV